MRLHINMNNRKRIENIPQVKNENAKTNFEAIQAKCEICEQLKLIF